MYLNYMERWHNEAADLGLDITFVSVEYRRYLSIQRIIDLSKFTD